MGRGGVGRLGGSGGDGRMGGGGMGVGMGSRVGGGGVGWGWWWCVVNFFNTKMSFFQNLMKKLDSDWSS